VYTLSRPNPLAALLIVGGIAAGALLAFAAATGSLMILVGLVALAVVIATVADWTVGVPALLLVSCTDGFLKHLSASSFTYVLKDTLLALILIGLAVRLALKPADRPDGTRWRGMVVWSAYFGFLVTQLLHPAISLAGAVGAFRAHGGFAILFIVGAVYFQQRERLTRAANGVIVLCTLCALVGILQNAMGDRWQHISPGFLQASLHYASYPSIAARAAGVSGASFRMYGTLVDPAALGLACTYGILTAIAALARLRGFWRLLAILSIPLMGVGLELSQTRAAIGALAIGMVPLVVLLLQRVETRKFAIGGLLAIIVAAPVGVILTHGRIADRLLAVDSVDYAAHTRDVSRSEVIYELPIYPFGHGLGATGGGGNLRDGTGFAVDNVYFATLYETGIVGLATLLAFQGTMLYLGFRAALRAKSVGANTAFAGIVAAQVALLAASWFTQGAFDYAPLAQFFWLFSGAVARADAWA
jgi:hypothetical protein